MPTPFHVRVLGLAGLIWHGAASASAVLPLDTFPDASSSIGLGYAVGASFEWQEVAIPFHIAAPGRITRLDTGLTINSGMTPLLFGVTADPLIGNSFPTPLFERAICSSTINPFDPVDYCGQSAALYGYGDPDRLASGDFYSWTGALELEAGDYWVYGSLRGDDVFGRWFANTDVPTDTWATRGCALGFAQGVGCQWESVAWAPVSEFGPVANLGRQTPSGGGFATPLVRIEFEPGRRVPEPTSMALAVLSLSLLWAFRMPLQRSALK